METPPEPPPQAPAQQKKFVCSTERVSEKQLMALTTPRVFISVDYLFPMLDKQHRPIIIVIIIVIRRPHGVKHGPERLHKMSATPSHAQRQNWRAVDPTPRKVRKPWKGNRWRVQPTRGFFLSTLSFPLLEQLRRLIITVVRRSRCQASPREIARCWPPSAPTRHSPSVAWGPPCPR